MCVRVCVCVCVINADNVFLRQGALSGILASLGLLLWIGMGAFVNKIKTPVAYTLTTACNWTAMPTAAPVTLAAALSTSTTTEAPSL